MSFIYAQSFVRLRAPRLRDRDGTLSAQRDWANATSTTVTGVSIQPEMTTEARDGAGVVVTDTWRIFSRRGVRLDLVNGDRVLWDGRTLDVIGAPQSWGDLANSAGWHHSEIVVKQSPFTRLDATGVAATTHDQALNAANTQRIYTP